MGSVDTRWMPDPRLSILIPNYNNGRSSTKSGQDDLIADLFESLLGTLQHDPTPLEIIVCDDGSTDDSLDTCREWAKRTWRGGQPFLRLIEREHVGILSITANILTAEAKGEFCVRLDGDITCQTPNWAAELCRTFDEGPPSLGVIGPKQLGIDGMIHSAGDWILHPRGNHHIAGGAPPDSVTRAIEVDHVMGCFYCHRKRVWAELGGYDEEFLRGQTVDFGLRARLHGWRCFSIPTVKFVHRHALRTLRETRADTAEGITATLDTFERKWGFNRIAPDLDAVRERYAGTPLLWNPRVFGPANGWPPISDSPIDIASSDWTRYTQDAPFRQLIDSRITVYQELIRVLGERRRVLHPFSRSGLICHLLAREGVSIVGTDPDPHFMQLARSVVEREQYPGNSPEFAFQASRQLPVDTGSVDTVLLFDVMERHPNPTALIAEAHRVLEPGGMLLIVTPERPSPFDRDWDQLHYYRPHELRLQLGAAGLFTEYGAATQETSAGLIVMLAQRLGPALCVQSESAADQPVGV